MARVQGEARPALAAHAEAQVDVIVAEHKELRGWEEGRPDAQPLEVLARAPVQALRHVEEDHVAMRRRLVQQLGCHGDGARVGGWDERRRREQEAEPSTVAAVGRKGGAQLRAAPEADG